MTQKVTDVLREAAPARPVLRRALAGFLVALWVAWAVPAWLSSLHQVRADEFAADVRAGRVVGFQAVSNVRDEPWRFSSSVGSWQSDVPAADAEGRPDGGAADGLVYTVEGVRTRWLSEPATVVGDRDAFAALAESGARPLTPETFPPSRDWMAFPACAAFLVWLAGLFTLRPRWGTRPFWVLVGFVPAGLGILAYAVVELSAGRSPGAVGSRLRWWHGVLVAVVGGLAVAALRASIS